MSLLYGYESTVVFCLAMFVGMALEVRLTALRLIFSAGELVGLGVTKTGPTQTV